MQNRGFAGRTEKLGWEDGRPAGRLEGEDADAMKGEDCKVRRGVLESWKDRRPGRAENREDYKRYTLEGRNRSDWFQRLHMKAGRTEHSVYSGKH